MSTDACFGLVGKLEKQVEKSRLQKIFRKCFSFATAVLIIGVLLPQFARATQIVWTNKASGTWETAVNWSPNQVPGPNDAATITNSTAITVSVLASETVSGLTISTSSLVGSNQMQISGQLYMTNATVALPIELESQATGAWAQGDLSGTLTVDSGATLVMTNTVVRMGGYNLQHSLTNRATILNNGTLIQGSLTLNAYNATLQNNGLLHEVGDDQMNYLTPGTSNLFVNTGDYEKTGGTNGSDIGAFWHFNSTGTINTLSGPLGISMWIGTNIINGFLNSGGMIPDNATVTVATNSTMFWSYGDIDGVLTVDSGAALTFGVVYGDDLTFGNQNEVLGLTNVATLINNGLVISSIAFIACHNTVFNNIGTWQASGLLDLIYSGSVTPNYFINSGVFNAGGSGGIETSATWVINNSGTIIAGSFNVQSLVQSSGSIFVQNPMMSDGFDLLGGTFSGAGTIVDCINDGGTLIPGTPFGKLNIVFYTQTERGTLDIFLGGPTNEADNSELMLPGTFSLGGQLNIFLTNNYLPDLGTSYTIITGPSGSNLQTNFSAVSFPSNVVNMSLMTDSTGTNLDVYIEPPIGPTFYKSNFVAQLMGIPGTSYTIEATASLSQPDWQKVTNATAGIASQGVAGVIQIDDPAIATNRFYRAVTPAY
jgi:hypothetical protein